MQRNLCGCQHPLARVDIVLGGCDERDNKQSFVGRRITLHANNEAIELVRRELQVHSYLAHQYASARGDPASQHPFIVYLHGHYVHQDSIHILTEYYPVGNLLSVIHPETSTPLSGLRLFASVERLQNAVRQLCAAVAFIHREGIAHMDIALENLYVDAQGNLHLGDFRYAIVDGKTRGKKRSAPHPRRREYAAPELFSGREVELLKADAWSVGIIVVMLVTTQRPFDEATVSDVHYRLLQVLGVRGFLDRLYSDVNTGEKLKVTSIVEDFGPLLADLLVCEPDTRCTVQDAIEKHPWLKLEASSPVIHGSSPQSVTQSSSLDYSTVSVEGGAYVEGGASCLASSKGVDTNPSKVGV